MFAGSGRFEMGEHPTSGPAIGRWVQMARNQFEFGEVVRKREATVAEAVFESCGQWQGFFSRVSKDRAHQIHLSCSKLLVIKTEASCIYLE